MILFIAQLPVLSFVLGFFLQPFLFSFMSSVMLSMVVSAGVFIFMMNYPKVTIKSKSKDMDTSLPFATLYLSTVSGSKLPLYKIFEIFNKFTSYDELANQIHEINEDIKIFGLDVNTALERAVERSPSKNFKELLYGILSTVRSGADLSVFLKEKSRSFMAEYRRQLYEFAHSLTLYIEVYLTAIVLGSIFFTILTSILSGIGGVSGNIIMLQFFLVFVFIPMISLVFIMLIRSITPGGE
jgi:flagellar protein FlaJ